MLVFRIELDTRHVDDRTLDNRSPCPEGSRWTRREYAIRRLQGFGGVVVLGDTVEQFTVKLIERAEEPGTEPDCAPHDGVEHRLHVGRRAGDNTEDVARRGLLLQRLSDLRV